MTAATHHRPTDAELETLFIDPLAVRLPSWARMVLAQMCEHADAIQAERGISGHYMAAGLLCAAFWFGAQSERRGFILEEEEELP